MCEEPVPSCLLVCAGSFSNCVASRIGSMVQCYSMHIPYLLLRYTCAALSKTLPSICNLHTGNNTIKKRGGTAALLAVRSVTRLARPQFPCAVPLFTPSEILPRTSDELGLRVMGNSSQLFNKRLPFTPPQAQSLVFFGPDLR